MTATRTEIVTALAEKLGPDFATEALTFDGDHEELSDPDAWVITWEGDYPDVWTIAASELLNAKPELGWFAEPVNTCILALYPADEYAF